MGTWICRHLLFVATGAALVACAEGEGSDGGRAPVADARNEAVVLLAAEWAGSWPAGLDPATNTTARANLSQMNAIFGGLFQLAPTDRGFEVVGVLAESYEVIDEGRTILIRLKRGIRFSDGTPFDAEAVQFNIVRNLGKSCTCSPSGWPWLEGNPVTTIDDHTVALRFNRPYAPVMHAIPGSNVNWIASPTALKAMGEEQFRITPIGAGPFKVVSNQLSTKLVLERNPGYFEDGKPYLDRLIFQSIGSEQAAYQALLAGDAHAIEGMTSTPVIRQAQQNDRLEVTQQPTTSPYVVQLNTARPPFDDKRAREAIYYATNVEEIRAGLFNNWYPVSQSFTGPGGLFHHQQVDRYRTHDLQQARAIVNDLGGLKITLGTLRSFVAEQVITALQSQWRQAGIEVTIATYDIAPLIERFQSGNWDAMLQTAGSYDPEAGASVSFRFRSDQRYTGVHDSKLDGLLDHAAAIFDPTERERVYAEVSEYISDQAYAPFLFAFAPTQVVVRGLAGPGLTTQIPPIFINTGILWQDVRFVTE
jgi:peptide/nickel transport system substrate-binding protein